VKLEFLDFYPGPPLHFGRSRNFALGMVMLVTIPRLCRRLHVPAAVGLLLGGVIVGPYVLGFFSTDRPIADFMADLGKLLLMFFAGLEIDLALFLRARKPREVP
jgi:Kef-type K+ transport system membrane component KefB